jgi:coenzyme F420-reducing hydrogenase beta subunit
MKSARMAESFAWQMGVTLDAVAALDYRLKDPTRPANWYTAHLALKDGSSRSRDWWDLADGDWGAGFFQNPACDACDDVVAETADIAFGDAWVEPYASDGRGTNVVVVRSPVLRQMVEAAIGDGRLDLRPVDPALVVERSRIRSPVAQHIQESRGLDFRGYKRTSLRRRITLRMEALAIEDFGRYQAHLEAIPASSATCSTPF